MSEKEINAILRTTTPSLGFYLGVIVLAIFAPQVAAFGYLVVAIVVLRSLGKATSPKVAEPTYRRSEGDQGTQRLSRRSCRSTNLATR